MKGRLILFFVFGILLAFVVNASAGYGEDVINITEDKELVYDKRTVLAALYEADIDTVRQALDMRLITCRELVEYYLERINEYDSSFKCFITVCDNALSEADKRDALFEAGAADGKLFGIPVIVKDNIEYAGYYTTNGNKFENSRISDENALIVKYLLDEGAIIIGKSNMSTSAQEARASRSKAIGETYNAYNTRLASGGSSGGSAVATSLNMGMTSLGTDTNSSLRYPAALNGCISLRTTTGLISNEGCISLNRQRDTAGAITRTVKDQAIMLDVITGGKGDYAESLNDNVLNGMRIGIIIELAYEVKKMYGRTDAAIDDEVEAAFENAIRELEACGAEVIRVSMPDIFDMSSACDEDKDGWKAAKERYYAEFKALLADNDISAVIFPTYLSAPLYTGVNEAGGLAIYDQIWTSNCSVLAPPMGVPEISVPIGIHSRGAGIGMEIAALKNNEQLLLDIAYSYTELYNHRKVPETAPDIYEKYYEVGLDEFIILYNAAVTEAERLKAEEFMEQETSMEEETEPATTTVCEKVTETEEMTTDYEAVTETRAAETTIAEIITETVHTMTTAVTEISTVLAADDSTTVKLKDVLADYNSDEDKLGKILWFVFMMLILLVVVGNFIILYHEDEKKRREK